MDAAQAGKVPETPAGSDGAETRHWQRTLWTMVGVQFVMSIAFSILSPIMPLFLPQLGVVSPQAVDVWAGVLASITSFVAIFTAPIWGSLSDRYGRKVMDRAGKHERHPVAAGDVGDQPTDQWTDQRTDKLARAEQAERIAQPLLRHLRRDQHSRGRVESRQRAHAGPQRQHVPGVQRDGHQHGED
jgi:hypothetical protein